MGVKIYYRRYSNTHDKLILPLNISLTRSDKKKLCWFRKIILGILFYNKIAFKIKSLKYKLHYWKSIKIKINVIKWSLFKINFIIALSNTLKVDFKWFWFMEEFPPTGLVDPDAFRRKTSNQRLPKFFLYWGYQS